MKTEAKYNLQVFETVDALNVAAAKLIIEIAHKAIAEKGKFTFAFSGGSTPTELYSLLSEPFYCSQIEWNKTFVFWGDERYVALDDVQNNAHQAKLALLNKINIPQSNIHVIQTNLSPVEAANSYEKELRLFFNTEPMRFDLILLGLGENGHTASLFPNTQVLQEQSARIKEVYLKEENKYRITMTAPVINMATHIIFLVAGSKKAEIVRDIFTTTDKYPAQLIQPVNGELTWLMDSQAASLIRKN